MNDEPPRIPATFAQYVAAERESTVKHQWIGGEVFDMSGGSPEHAALIAVLIALLHTSLRGGACRTYSSDLRVRAGDMVTYPDVTVVCGALDRDPEDDFTVCNPTLVVEVLSDSTEAFDRGKKAEHYRRIPSLREYMLVSQREPHIEVVRRTEAGWVLLEWGKGETAKLESIGCELAVDVVYEAVGE